MKKSKIVTSKGETYFIRGRSIPKGCKYCLEGAKAVLFLNGICQKPDHCSWYCPISEERRGKDISFANEIKINSKEDLLEEINKIKAKGMSITGGEPLSKQNLEKTLNYIKYIKSVKGKNFHIHLYTNGINFNKEIAEKLTITGLDEIRFHPPKDKWPNIEIAINKGISVGAEVPIIPNYEYIRELMEFILFLEKIGAEFINLNEFEYCFPNSQSLKDRGFHLKEGTIASVENSKNFALDLIKNISPKVSLKIHFCPIIAKDYYQLKNRYLRRAKTIKLPHEEITEEGLLLYALIEGNSSILKETYSLMLSDLNIPENLILLGKDNIKLPYYIALEEKFIKFLDEYDLNGYVHEIIPFRGKYCQITERTPLKVFKQEVGLNEN